jgi:5-deoxy-glucuronate isomerase
MLNMISAPDKLLVSGTASHRGRFIAVSPKNNPVAHIAYGRIRLDFGLASAAFETGDRETALMCMKGACRVAVDGTAHELDTFDALYVPRGSAVEVSTTTEVDIVECSADVEGIYPLQVIRYAEVAKNPTLKFTTGGPATLRDLNIIIGKNVQAGRLLAGFTRSHPGNWTSWPPHEHTKMLEEIYVFFDMPAPAFAIQLVYTQPDKPEFVRLVHDGDAVLIPKGYHPTVAAPGCINNFIWIMAAHREVEDRQFGVVNVQPEFDQGGSGLEASRK